MNISPLDSALLSPLLSDAETAELFSDGATVQAMLDFERALARVEEQLEVLLGKYTQSDDSVTLIS